MPFSTPKVMCLFISVLIESFSAMFNGTSLVAIVLVMFMSLIFGTHESHTHTRTRYLTNEMTRCIPWPDIHLNLVDVMFVCVTACEFTCSCLVHLPTACGHPCLPLPIWMYLASLVFILPGPIDICLSWHCKCQVSSDYGLNACLHIRCPLKECGTHEWEKNETTKKDLNLAHSYLRKCNFYSNFFKCCHH